MEYLKLPSIEGFSLMGGDEEEAREKDCGEQCEEAVCAQMPECTYQTRIYGCLACLGFGFMISLGSTMRLTQLMMGKPTPFAVMYTSGNIISICATMFLYGPWTQAKRMFAPERYIATIVYLSLMACTLTLAYYPGFIPLRLVFIVVSILSQFFALLWYTLSYIPYGRSLTLSCLRNACPGYVGSALNCDCLTAGGESGAVEGAGNEEESSSSSVFRGLW